MHKEEQARYKDKKRETVPEPKPIKGRRKKLSGEFEIQYRISVKIGGEVKWVKWASRSTLEQAEEQCRLYNNKWDRTVRSDTPRFRVNPKHYPQGTQDNEGTLQNAV